jgi:hypothetical protein
MPAAPVKYRKLPGRGYGIGETSRLYLAEDHLLLVSAAGFHENYRRFYFRDIQAITLRKTITGAVFNGILIGVLVPMVFLVGSFATQNEMIGWSIPIGILAGLLAFNFLRGPSCACQIHTAVQTRRLGPMNRLRSAERTLARLRPLIEAAQGAVPADELRARLDQARQYPNPADAPPVMS